MTGQNQKTDILCAGLAAVDTIFGGVSSVLMQVDNIVADTYMAQSGGDAVNGAVSCARLGLRTGISCVVGNDMQGHFILDELTWEGVDVSGVIVQEDIPTSAPVVMIDENGERHIVRLPRTPNHIYTGSMIPDEVLRNTRHLHVASANSLPALDGEPLAQLFARAKRFGVTTSMDTNYDKAGDWLAKIEKALPLCDVFIPSLQEASVYAGTEDIGKITEFFSGYGISVFGVKLGERGAYVTNFSEQWTAPSFYKGQPVDTTGAGDAFFAGFLAAWLREMPLPDCLGIASAQSASVLGAAGAHTSAGSWDEAFVLLQKNKERISGSGTDGI